VVHTRARKKLSTTRDIPSSAPNAGLTGRQKRSWSRSGVQHIDIYMFVSIFRMLFQVFFNTFKP
jgi:hypothetical protein